MNPGFEAGTTDWSENGGGTLSVVGSQVHSGNLAATLSSDSVGTKWIYQVVSIQEGGTYTFCGYALKNDSNITSMRLRISWYKSEDGFGSEITHHDSLTALIEDHPQYRLLTTGDVSAPPNAHSALVKAIVEPASAATATTFAKAHTNSYDDTNPDTDS
jgi:hypothetical protein